jgi:hypothetical protein
MGPSQTTLHNAATMLAWTDRLKPAGLHKPMLQATSEICFWLVVTQNAVTFSLMMFQYQSGNLTTGDHYVMVKPNVNVSAQNSQENSLVLDYAVIRTYDKVPTSSTTLLPSANSTAQTSVTP